MARIYGLERINRYPSHNKLILKNLGIEPKKGKLKAVIDFINELSYNIVMQETCALYSSSDFFTKSHEVFSFIANSLTYLPANVSNRGCSSISIDIQGFSNYEGISISFLNKHKDLILFELNQTDLI